ncbi:Ger(x)C family spore germination protein [Paenibacillus elgii]|uniref:Ger(x)C family spore germination protein n=1 Tax=Paenibacillus elgii TaxID=189691 RepID=UPI0013D0BE5C|nr:Ger(x)C family spore germination protein [Paenibacillus elgii]
MKLLKYALVLKMKAVGSLCLLVLLTGCWSSVELNDRSFVRVMIVGKAKEGIELSLGFPLPNRMIPGMVGAGSGKGKPYVFITKTGGDIGEAYRKIQSDLSRKITFGQASTVIVSDDFAREGISNLLDFLAREPKFHVNANVFVSFGKADDIASAPAVFERFPVDILTGYVKQNVTLRTTVKDFLMARYYGGDVLVPSLVFTSKKIADEQKPSGKWMGTDGAVVFKQNKMVGTLDTMEMRGALWITGQLQDAEISVPSPTDGKLVSFMIEQMHSKIKPVLTGDGIAMHITTKASAEMLGSDSRLNTEDRKQLSELEQRLDALVEQRMNSAIAKTKEVRADAFQFAKYIDWNYPRLWKSMKPQWREWYRNRLKPVIQVNISIKRLGTVQQSATHTEETE